MRYFIATTDFHRRVISGIAASPLDATFGMPRKLSFRALATVARALVTVFCDRNSEVYIAHPCSGWFALFAFASKRVQIFDDGVAYYRDSALPEGAAQSLYRLLTSRHFDWRVILAEGQPSYRSLLRGSRADAYHAVLPGLLPSLPIRTVPVNLDKAFVRRFDHGEDPGIILFLDRPRGTVSEETYDRLFLKLRELASEASPQRIWFTAHPGSTSKFSERLKTEPWAEFRSESAEYLAEHYRIRRVYSFYSSAAISIRLVQPDAEICTIAPDVRVETDVRDEELFTHLGAIRVEI